MTCRVAIIAGMAVAILANEASAETVLAARTIRAQTIIGPADITVVDVPVPGGMHPDEPIIGMETRVAVYAGRPIRHGDIGPPAIVERNQIVPLIYREGGVVIETEGRALGRGGVGDHLRVMNIASRSTVGGTIQPDGAIVVSGSDR